MLEIFRLFGNFNRELSNGDIVYFLLQDRCKSNTSINLEVICVKLDSHKVLVGLVNSVDNSLQLLFRCMFLVLKRRGLMLLLSLSFK